MSGSTFRFSFLRHGLGLLFSSCLAKSFFASSLGPFEMLRRLLLLQSRHCSTCETLRKQSIFILEVEQLVDSGRGFLASFSGTKNSTKSKEKAKKKAQTAELSEAETILFLVFYAPTIDNREAGAAGALQEQKAKVLDASILIILIVRWALSSSSSTSAA